jgi:hypothetical protein
MSAAVNTSKSRQASKGNNNSRNLVETARPAARRQAEPAFAKAICPYLIPERRILSPIRGLFDSRSRRRHRLRDVSAADQ